MRPSSIRMYDDKPGSVRSFEDRDQSSDIRTRKMTKKYNEQLDENRNNIF